MQLSFTKFLFSVPVGWLALVLLAPTSILAQDLVAPSKLHFLRPSSQANRVTLFWEDRSSGETGYLVEAKEDGGDWQEFAQLGANATTFSSTNLNSTISTNFRVKAISGSGSSGFSDEVRLVGSRSPLEVYPEVPGIRNPKDTLIGGITFSLMQDQCPAEPDQGKATRISTFYEVRVRTANGSDFLSSPVYETRPQIRNKLAQDDPNHSRGHRTYGYHSYGPNRNRPNRRMHSRHWTNFDAQEDVVVRVKLLPSGNFSGPIDPNDLEIPPTPLAVNQLGPDEIEVTLPGAPDYARHYRIAMNRKAWAAQGDRGANTYEAPLFIFINPVHLAPGSAPEGEVVEHDDGKLVIFGPGIHLAQDRYRFFGVDENATLRELYAPGNAYLHYGFLFNNDGYAIKVWGRAMYSDEMYDVYLNNNEYDWSNPDRTPWSSQDCLEGNAWGIDPAWEAHVGFYNLAGQPSTFEGFTNIGARMGPFNQNGNIRMLDHKDVGYGGGTYQAAIETKSYYEGCLFHNDDDITYAHREYQMLHCTSYNLRNGPTFQYGWGIKTNYEVPVRIVDHVALPSDRPNGNGAGKNHGVFNTRLKIGQLEYHNGGIWENFEVYGQEGIVFKLVLWDEGDHGQNAVSIFEDKTYLNFTIHQHSRQDNLIWGDQSSARNVQSYFRFLHFDNLIIEGRRVESIEDGDFFDYNEAALLHTITFFSLPNPLPEPAAGNAP
ncbi:MAG: fibronectin type III domain-containing protein, partial [Bacteroidota bacterium]